MKACFATIACLLGAPAAALCPDPSGPAVTHKATGPALLVPQSWDITVGGDQTAPCAEWAAQGTGGTEMSGLLPLAPTVAFDLTGLGPHILMVTAEAVCNPILVARTRDGVWYFGQPRNGREEITLWGAGDGLTQVWVGSAQDGTCDGMVTLETFDR